MMRKIAVFDFDGTITTKDTFIVFARFACGMPKTIAAFILFMPLLIAMRLHLFDNGKVKQMLFSFLFKKMPYKEFTVIGERFADVIDCMLRNDTIQKIQHHSRSGDTIYIVSASINEWISPWCLRNGINRIISTEVEVRNGCLTGNFSTKNCNGYEKVHRFLEAEPDRNSYILIVYGDSHGDYPIMAIADKAIKL